LSTKIHHAVDGKGRPLSVVVTGGQRNDGSMLQVVIDDIRVPQPAGRSGRPRTTPDAVMADRAYPSRANREYLRDRGIAAVIPEKVDHVNARKRKGSAGGRPPKMDWEAYKGRNVVERSFNLLKQWRGLATRYDKLAVIYRGAAVLAAIVAWLKALKLAELGVDAIVLSNHGGRQLDRAPVPFQLLPSVRDAVGEDFELIVDTGIMNGADIVAALASGADFTLIGRAYLYGLMAGGREGVDRTIAILKSQIERTMKLLQVNTVDELVPEHVTQLSRFNRVEKPGQTVE
jgi:transposase